MKKTILLFLCIFIVIMVRAQQKEDSAKTENWSYHFQVTAIKQGHPPFKALYSGQNSLVNKGEKALLSITSTLYAGRRLWKGAAIYIDGEIAGGSGISSTKGVAGFTNGETFRIGDPSPTLYIARGFITQDIALNNSSEEKEVGGINQLAGNRPSSRISITAGKFDISDFYDNNKYAHDPRVQFLNWSLMSNAAWDYPANTRGYTSGLVVELIKPGWAARLSSVVVPKMANGPKMDWQINKAHGETFEFEKNWTVNKLPGTVRLLGFHNLTQAPTYKTTIAEVKAGDSSSLDVYSGNREWKKYGGLKYGFGLNAEQDFTPDFGMFFRASWNDGKTASWAYTEIDRSTSLGANIKGISWKRPEDNIGIAGVFNGISPDHQAFLNAGLYGFIIGDGKLNYGKEGIAECYYQAKLATSLWATFDYQFINNPAYNKDRGPVSVFAVRAHIEF
jgi:high affinity Mn2+ porin